MPDQPIVARIPTRPPLPGADAWVMGLYADADRGVLLVGTRTEAPRPAAAVTVIDAEVLAGLDRALDTLRLEPASDDEGFGAFLADAAALHADITLHAVTLWSTDERRPAGSLVSHHDLPVRASWRGFLNALIALDSTSHPESSRRVFLDLVAALERPAQSAGRSVRW
ncbi:sugar kinase, partial [Streptomyces sp. MCAF7]